MENAYTPEVQLQKSFGLTCLTLERAMAAALKRRQGGAFCEIYLQAGTTEGLTWDQGILKNPARHVVSGAGVRVMVGDRTGYSYTDHVNATNLRRCALAASAIANYAGDEVTVPLESKGKAHDLYPFTTSFLSMPLSEKIELLRKIDAEARAVDPRISNVTISLATDEQVVVIANSLGVFVADRRPLLRLKISCLAEEGMRREQGTAGGGGRVEFAFLLANDWWRRHARKAAEEAVALLSASPAPAGEMTVVLGCGWPGVLIHEAVGHGLEGDFNRKGTSAFSNLVGQRVASPLCTVIDDGTMVARRGSLNIDDEGTPTQRTVLIENGVLKGYMQDRLNAGLMAKGLTGNGRRESYRFKPMPRMTNTFLAGGQSTPEEIIASVKYGLYATTFGGGQVDITNGEFTFTAAAAYLIEDGKLTQAVKGATLIGNGPKALRKVAMVGNDVDLDQGVGTCGKLGQGVPVCVGMPTIRIDGVTVGGTKS